MTIALQAKRAADFAYEMLVDCPRCGKEAVVRPLAPASSGSRSPVVHRLICVHCGYTRDDQEGHGKPRRLRLRAVTRHGELVFYNRDHLQYVMAFIRSEDRRVTVVDGGVRNGSITSRLPRWAKLAANRDDVLRALERLSRT